MKKGKQNCNVMLRGAEEERKHATGEHLDSSSTTSMIITARRVLKYPEKIAVTIEDTADVSYY